MPTKRRSTASKPKQKSEATEQKSKSTVTVAKKKPMTSKPMTSKPTTSKPTTSKPKQKFKPKAKSSRPRYMCTKTPVFHPYQRVPIGTYPGVQLDLDNWLKCQIERGLVKVV